MEHTKENRTGINRSPEPPQGYFHNTTKLYTIRRYTGKINTRSLRLIGHLDTTFDTFQEALDAAQFSSIGTSLTELTTGSVTLEWVNSAFVGQKL